MMGRPYVAPLGGSFQRLITRNSLIEGMRYEAVGYIKDSRWFDITGFCHERLVRDFLASYTTRWKSHYQLRTQSLLTWLRQMSGI